MTKPTKGVFIVFEGIDFSGKTTQAKKLADFLRQTGFEVVLTKEPGGTPEGLKIRERLLHEKLSVWEELDLFFQDRRIHVEKVINPALAAGQIVISDRFSPSTIAYQGGGRQLDLELISEKDGEIRAGLWPDLIILLDGDPEKLKKRFSGRNEKLTVIEKNGPDFFRRARESFLKQASQDPERWRIINAGKGVDDIFEEVKHFIGAFLAKRGE